ncbi:MAG TPA: hypothetical protein VGA96_01285, partial [Fibrella sp.]
RSDTGPQHHQPDCLRITDYQRTSKNAPPDLIWRGVFARTLLLNQVRWRLVAAMAAFASSG